MRKRTGSGKEYNTQKRERERERENKYLLGCSFSGDLCTTKRKRIFSQMLSKFILGFVP